MSDPGSVNALSEGDSTSDGVSLLLGFTRALRAAGVSVTQDRAQTFVAAAAEVSVSEPALVYAAGTATLCGSPADLVRYAQVFEAYFGSRDGLPRPRPATPSTSTLSLPTEHGEGASDESSDDVLRARASDLEVLRHRDVADLTAAEKHQLHALLATLKPRPPHRRASRRQHWHRGRLDPARTLRASLQRMGEPAEIAWRRRKQRPRRVVLLIDVSGSMSGYAEVLLRLAHRINAPQTEVFTVGTRITHLTRALSNRDVEQALVAAGAAVPDWSGGTRLGENLQVFLDRWGRRGLARGSVVVIFSDGWERGDATLLGAQMQRLHRIAHRVVWVNPHRGKAGYQPIQQGIEVSLPYVDDFVAGHSLATYAELLEVLADA